MALLLHRHFVLRVNFRLIFMFRCFILLFINQVMTPRNWDVFAHSLRVSHIQEEPQVLCNAIIKPSAEQSPCAGSLTSVKHIRVVHAVPIISAEQKPNESPLYLNHSGWKYNNLSNSVWLDNESPHWQSLPNKAEPCRTRSEAGADEWVGKVSFSWCSLNLHQSSAGGS